MSEHYDEQVAIHYSKYRPPLHERILSRALDKSKNFDIGLDIGCGTGKSSIQLGKYCKKVFGIDPSQAMIDNAEGKSLITYVCGNEETLAQFESNKFDLVTFAGSLFYSKNKTLRHELARVCRAEAMVVIYDFEVLLDNFLQTIGLNLIPVGSSGYNHSINISDWNEFREEMVKKEQISLSLSVKELAHLILSHSTWHMELVDLFKEQYPFDRLTEYLRSKGKEFQLPVNIFYSQYRVGPKAATEY